MERELGCGTAREPDTRGPTGSERSKRPCSQHWYVDEYGGVHATCMRGGPAAPNVTRPFPFQLHQKDGSSAQLVRDYGTRSPCPPVSASS